MTRLVCRSQDFTVTGALTGAVVELAVELEPFFGMSATGNPHAARIRELAHAAERGGADVLVVPSETAARESWCVELGAMAQVLAVPLQIEMEIGALPHEAMTRFGPQGVCLTGRRVAHADGRSQRRPLDVRGQREAVKATCRALEAANIDVTLLLEAQAADIDAAFDMGACGVRFDTARFTALRDTGPHDAALLHVVELAWHARSLGLVVSAQAGLDLAGAISLAGVPDIARLYVGDALVATALEVGLERAVRDAKATIVSARLAAYGMVA